MLVILYNSSLSDSLLFVTPYGNVRGRLYFLWSESLLLDSVADDIFYYPFPPEHVTQLNRERISFDSRF